MAKNPRVNRNDKNFTVSWSTTAIPILIKKYPRPKIVWAATLAKSGL